MFGLRRPPDNAEQGAIGRVHARLLVAPGDEARVLVAGTDWRVEDAGLEKRKVVFHFTDDGDLVPILKVLAHARPELPAERFDSPLFQLVFGTDSREHQKLGRVKCSA